MSESGVTNPAYTGSHKNGDRDSMPEEDRKELQLEEVKVDVEKGTMEQSTSKDPDGKNFNDEEEKILEVLREVVRKCTNPDPMKRPSAEEVLEMLDNYSL